ncbi:MAG: PGPGW domain-containing protein [Gemmatimonadales bacterium]
MSALKEAWHQLRHGTPGRRFYDVHRARSERRGEGWPFERVLVWVVGVVLVLGGLAIGWLPGPGGFVAVIGVALLAAESLQLAKLLDHTELRLRAAWSFVRRKVLHRPEAESD